jgi:hypothetical protein
MDGALFPSLIGLIGSLLGFASAWLLQSFSHRQRVRETRLARLHERQAVVFSMLTGLLYQVQNAWARSQDLDDVDQATRTIIVKGMSNSEKRLCDYFVKNRMWLTESNCEEIAVIFPKLIEARQKCIRSSVMNTRMSQKENEDARKSLRYTVDEEIPAICKHLETGFRASIGLD